MRQRHPGPAVDIDWNELAAYRPELRAVVRGWVALDAVEDVVQEALLDAYKGRHTYDPALPLLPWLKQVARNSAKRRWRLDQLAAAAGIDLVADSSRFALHEVGSDDHVAQLAVRQTLQVVLASLPDRQRRFLVQSVFGRGSTDAMAAEEHVSVDAWRQTVKRARTGAQKAYVQTADLPPPAWALVPVVGGLLARVRGRIARLASSGWTDTVAASAVPAVMAGMAVVSSMWPLPQPTPPAPDATTRIARPAPVVHTGAPEPSPADAPPTRTVPSPAPRAAPPTTATTSSTDGRPPPERMETHVGTEHPGGRNETYVVLTVDCDAGTIGRLACAVTPP